MQGKCIFFEGTTAEALNTPDLCYTYRFRNKNSADRKKFEGKEFNPWVWNSRI
jgi:hypothetical protein